MNSEITSYAESLEGRLARIADIVRGLSADDLNWRPPVAAPNSVWIIATHTIGNARAWILGIVCGEDRHRDRPSEFVSTGSDGAALAAEIARAAADVRAALETLDPDRLDIRHLPPAELWGEGTPYELSVRDSILHVIEHASLHLGHLHMTMDLLRARA
jgi:uncharacterized damage-inducible protein DinB